MIKKCTLLSLLLWATGLLSQRNVILVIADDLGSDYCGFYENHADTCIMPNVRSLLTRGIRFRQAWSNPLCSPTRAGILTGRYSFRTGVGDAVGGTTIAVLDTHEVTIPRMLNKYKPIKKANIGKWHLHLATPKTNLILPNTMGYDHFEGNFTGVLNDYYDWTKTINGVSSNIKTYATIETVNNAIDWLDKTNGSQFFLWLAFNAPHSPFHLPPVDLHSYQNLSGTESDIEANPKPYFKAAVQAMDHELGRLIDHLKATGLYDNTDIIFIGDNGDDAKVAQKKGGAKGSIYQEGISVPFVISGPSVINPQRVSDALVNTQDLFATILELMGFADWQNNISSDISIDSKSLLPIINDKPETIRPWAFSEVFKNPTVSGDGKTMRNEDYKLLNFDNGSQKFFNISIDPDEENNLLATQMSSIDIQNYDLLCQEMTILLDKAIGPCTTSTRDESDKNYFPFPNPFSSTIYIPKLSTNDACTIYNSVGQVVYTGYNIEGTDFSFLPKGIYLLHISGNLKYYTYKIIKS